MPKVLRALRTTLRWLRWLVLTLLGLLALALILAQLRAPRTDKVWEPEWARTPRVASLAGDTLVLENFRDFRWAGPGEPATQTWRTETLDLSRIVAADFLVEPFGEWQGAAHTMLSFEFAEPAGSRWVVVSMETRREEGEAYSTWKGLFNQYELAYVIGGEEDLVALRGKFRGHEVYRFPVNGTPEAFRALFEHMALTADSLAERPEFYGTLWNSCTTRVAMHARQATGEEIPLSWRYVLPGFSGELAYDLGLTGTSSVPFAALEAEARIGQKIRDAYGQPNFSAAIRR